MGVRPPLRSGLRRGIAGGGFITDYGTQQDRSHPDAACHYQGGGYYNKH